MYMTFLVRQPTMGILAATQIRTPFFAMISYDIISLNLAKHQVVTHGQLLWSVKQHGLRSDLAPAQDPHLHQQHQHRKELGQGVGCGDGTMPCSYPSWHLCSWSCSSSQTWDSPCN